jgi:hypothetical protein
VRAHPLGGEIGVATGDCRVDRVVLVEAVMVRRGQRGGAKLPPTTVRRTAFKVSNRLISSLFWVAAAIA